MLCMVSGHVTNFPYSYHRQLRYDPFPETRNVSSASERRVWIRIYMRSLIRRIHRRHDRLALVFHRAGAHIRDRVSAWLARCRKPHGGQSYVEGCPEQS